MTLLLNSRFTALSLAETVESMRDGDSIRVSIPKDSLESILAVCDTVPVVVEWYENPSNDELLVLVVERHD